MCLNFPQIQVAIMNQPAVIFIYSPPNSSQRSFDYRKNQDVPRATEPRSKYASHGCIQIRVQKSEEMKILVCYIVR